MVSLVRNWRAIFNVNLRGLPKPGGFVGEFGEALESDFECKFTRAP